MMDEITDTHTKSRARRDFPAQEVEEVLAVLALYGEEEHETSPALIRLGVLMLARGDKGKVYEWIDVAKKDARDVLCPLQEEFGLEWYRSAAEESGSTDCAD